KREDELGGKTLVIAGLGRFGSRLATLAKAFDIRVVATRRDPSKGAGAADKVVGEDGLLGILPQADFVALTCPLTPKTENLIDAKALAAMKPSAYLINVARGRVVNEPALVEALNEKRIAGAALDCVWEEPLSATSGLWNVPNVLITPSNTILYRGQHEYTDHGIGRRLRRNGVEHDTVGVPGRQGSGDPDRQERYVHLRLFEARRDVRPRHAGRGAPAVPQLRQTR